MYNGAGTPVYFFNYYFYLIIFGHFFIFSLFSHNYYNFFDVPECSRKYHFPGFIDGHFWATFALKAFACLPIAKFLFTSRELARPSVCFASYTQGPQAITSNQSVRA